MEYLGLVVEERKISTDPVKVKGFADWLITNLCQRCSVFPRFWKFLLEIYSWIFDSGRTLKCSIEEGHRIPMD